MEIWVPSLLVTTPGCSDNRRRDPVGRQLLGVVAVDVLLGGHRVPRHQRVRRRRHVDFADIHRLLLQREILGDRLTRQNPQAGHADRLVSDELGDEVDRPRRNVVNEVVPTGIGHGAEGGAFDSYLRTGNRRARLIPYPSFEFTSRLGVERGRAHEQGDCRERDPPRCASEGADTAFFHGDVLRWRDTCLPLTRNIAKALIASRLPSTRVPDEQRLLLPVGRTAGDKTDVNAKNFGTPTSARSDGREYGVSQITCQGRDCWRVSDM